MTDEHANGKLDRLLNGQRKLFGQVGELRGELTEYRSTVDGRFLALPCERHQATLDDTQAKRAETEAIARGRKSAFRAIAKWIGIGAALITAAGGAAAAVIAAMGG